MFLLGDGQGKASFLGKIMLRGKIAVFFLVFGQKVLAFFANMHKMSVPPWRAGGFYMRFGFKKALVLVLQVLGFACNIKGFRHWG